LTSSTGIRTDFFVSAIAAVAAYFNVTHGRKSWIEFADQCLPTPAAGAVHTPADLPIDGTDNGIMRFLWNMPTGFLFLTTRSPRFAAF
jgi:hypothetical protein